MRILLGLWVLSSVACVTTNRAEALRERTRRLQAGGWTEQWNAAQESEELWSKRFELAWEFRANPVALGVTAEDVERSCSADVRSLVVRDDADQEAYLAASRWAEEVLKDAGLSGNLACRAAQGGGDYSLQMRCADFALGSHDWARAIGALHAAFAAARSSDEKCVVIQKVDKFSPAPESDARDFGSELVGACRRRFGSERSASAPTAVPSVSPTPQPVTRSEARSRAAPVISEGILGGAQIDSMFSSGSDGTNISVQVGYGSERFAISFAPSMAYAGSESTGTALSLALGITARFYFQDRVVATGLNPYVRPQLDFGVLQVNPRTSSLPGSIPSNLVTPTTGIFGLGASVGAEYLVTSHFGFSGELGVRLALMWPATVVGIGGAVGVVLHQ